MANVGLLRMARVVLAAISALQPSSALGEGQSADLEDTVCGSIKERLAFAAWSAAAGTPNLERWRSVRGAEPITHKTRDGRTLHGYKISAATAGGGSNPRQGWILVAQGNAMLADQLLSSLGHLADGGADVYIYDFRGYGNSEGRRRLKAIVSDYQEIFGTLASREAGRKHLYGISFGGIALLNVIGRSATFDRAVIDSTPSRISHFGCPTEFDPIGNLPVDSSSIMVVSGKQDRVVKPEDTGDLVSAAKSRGARGVVSDDFAHPYMDRDPTVHSMRQKMVRDFLFQTGQ